MDGKRQRRKVNGGKRLVLYGGIVKKNEWHAVSMVEREDVMCGVCVVVGNHGHDHRQWVSTELVRPLQSVPRLCFGYVPMLCS